MVEVLVIVVIVVGGIYWWLKRRLSFWKRRGLVYVKPRLLMGNLRKKHHIALAIAESYTKLSMKAQLGGFYVLQRATILPLDAHLVAKILHEDSPHFTMDEYRDYIKRDFVMSDSTWKNIWPRAMSIACDFTMTHGHINAFDTSLRYNVQFIAHCFLGWSTKDPKLGDLEKLARKYLKLSTMKHMKNIFNQAYPQITSLLGVCPMNDIQKSFEKLIAEHETNDKHYLKLIKTIVNGQSVGKKIDLENVRRGAFGLFIAAIEASVGTTAFCMYELAKSQDIQNILRREITHILPKSHHHHITYENMAQMKYTDSVIFETLRKYPPIGCTWRITRKEYYVPNSTYIIEEGMPVVVPVYAIHHDPRYYVNPEKFDPQRFLSGMAEGTFLPFGRRDAISIEMHFAIMQIKLMLVTLLKEFHISQPQPDALAINPKAPTLTPKK
uniref:Putative cytochrome p450 cyp3/cyp5/cyp6/cyp9 subfamily n=1 Tax=Nyssomyia neivai TaxID=330878 RepID=A0A1L8E4R2_9DIPT